MEELERKKEEEQGDMGEQRMRKKDVKGEKQNNKNKEKKKE